MTTYRVDFEIDRGATFQKVMTWKTGNPAVPVDLTHCTARMQVREHIDSPTHMLRLTTENGGIMLGGVDGTIMLRVEAAQTSELPKLSGVYDLEIEFSEGTVRRLLSGNVTISPEVTRG